jgi:DNA repair exonuclease SbcCD ATPase subunit
MIQSVELVNWKAYAHIQVELGPGTTFVVAHNGVGKSSLVQGAMWTIFGGAALRFPSSQAIRGEATSASGRVELAMPTGQLITITRRVSLGASGRATEEVSFEAGGRSQAGSRALAVALENACNMSLDFLARLLVLEESAVAQEIDPRQRFDLSGYISQLFGTDSLAAASEAARQISSRLSKEGDQVRRDQGANLSAEIASRAEALDELSDRISQLSEERLAAQAAADRIRSDESLRVRWAEYDRAVAEVSDRRRGIEQQAMTFLGAEAPPEDLVAALTVAATQVRDECQRLRNLVAQKRAELALLERTEQMLSNSSTECPVCRRALDAEAATSAMHLHESDRLVQQDALDQASTELVSAEAQLAQLDELVGSLVRMQLPVPPAEPKPTRDVAEARAELDILDSSTRHLSEQIGEVRRERDELARRQEADRDAAKANARAIGLYRSAELANAVHLATDYAIDRIRERHVSPLADELRSRWKDMWPDQHGLQLAGDGTLALVRGTRTITYDHFSGAEKALSLIALRLLLVQMSSSMQMLWLDEPLEHLDPRNRRVLASLLASATAQGALRQIVVTTYEEPVVRRLREPTIGRPSRVLYVRSDADDVI